MAVLIGGVRERAVRIGDPHPLIGIVSEPVDRARPQAPAFLILNAGIVHRVGPSRIGVLLARALAGDGFTALRFDFSGIGDSPHRPDDRAFDERSVAEAREVMDYLATSHGAERFVLLGLCSGAEVSFATALADERVVGLVSLDGHAYRTWRYWVHRYRPRLLRAESWLNLLMGRTYVGPFVRSVLGRMAGRSQDDDTAEVELFRTSFPERQVVTEGYQTLADRGVRMLQIFTAGIEGSYNYANQFRDAFRTVDFGGTLRLEFQAGADHTFTDPAERRALLASVTGWAGRLWRHARQAELPVA